MTNQRTHPIAESSEESGLEVVGVVGLDKQLFSMERRRCCGRAFETQGPEYPLQ